MMKIGSRTIGPDEPPYVIAEIGVNHDGDAARALSLIRSARDAGADAVKFQYFSADLLMSRSARLAEYQRESGERDPAEMLRRLELRAPDMRRCVDRAHELGLHAIVTVFSVELVGEASLMGWDAYKFASPDIVHKPLIDSVAGIGMPMILSTGASTLDEAKRACTWLGASIERAALLHCVSSYPCAAADANLLAIDALGSLAPAVGYSDHTTAEDTGALAVLCGASILEKHLTYSRRAVGPDHAASLDAKGFKRYVARAREAWKARRCSSEVILPRDVRFGDGRKRVLACEQDVRNVSRQSIVAARTIEAGERIRIDALRFARPGGGLEPWRLDEILGTAAPRTLLPGECVSLPRAGSEAA